jgi:hypothetical protein
MSKQPNAPVVRQQGENFLTTRSQDFELRDNGSLAGIGNMIGELDSYWTVSHPRSKAFSREGIEKFVQSGCMLAGHKSWEAPIGYIKSAAVVGREFQVEAEYHSDAESQRYRTIAKERKDAGKTVGLSIGFWVSRYEYFENGKEMVKALRDLQEDMSLFNVAQLEAHNDDCWLMYVEDIGEVSQVNFQSNKPSVATDVRSEGEAPTLDRTFARMKEMGVRVTAHDLLAQAREAGVIEDEDPGDQQPAEPPVEDTRDLLAEMDALRRRRR